MLYHRWYGDENKKIDIGTYGWIYKSKEELENETMVKVSKRKFKTIFDKFIKNGWVDRRNNPLYKWDRTYQYRLNLVKIADGLNNLGYNLTGYHADIKKAPSKVTNVPTEGDESIHHSEHKHPSKVEPDTSYTRDYYRDHNSKITEENTNTWGISISSKPSSEDLEYVPATFEEYEQYLGIDGSANHSPVNGSADSDTLSDADYMNDAVKLHFLLAGDGLDDFQKARRYEHYIPKLLIRRPHLAEALLDKFISHPKSQIPAEELPDIKLTAYVHYQKWKADQNDDTPHTKHRPQSEFERKNELVAGFEEHFPATVDATN